MIRWEDKPDLPDIRTGAFSTRWIKYPGVYEDGGEGLPYFAVQAGPIVEHRVSDCSIYRVHFFSDSKRKAHRVMAWADQILGGNGWVGMLGFVRKLPNVREWDVTMHLVAEMDTRDEADQFTRGWAWRA